MEAKQIYNAFNKRFYQALWLNENGVAISSQGLVFYDYAGVGNEFKKDTFNAILDAYFDDDELYLSITATKSFFLKKENIADTLFPFLGKKEIGIMNPNMDKLIFISHIGTFKKGIYKEFPKSREKEPNTPLLVSFHANMYEHKTQRISQILQPFFEKIEKKLHNDYGGIMEHLWIDIMLVEGKDTFAFRFQKRVGIYDFSGSSISDYCYNVGHYSIAPDFEILEKLQTEAEICHYIADLLYTSMEVLQKKAKTLGEFDAQAFRSDFVKACAETIHNF